MSVSGVKILCNTLVELDPNGVPIYATRYHLSAPVGGHTEAGTFIPIDDMTESTFNSQMAQAIANQANVETGGVEAFVASDVIGGRI